MARRRIQLLILCEDLQHEVFARRFFQRHGFQHWQLDFNTAPKGKGAGEQYVREQYRQEVKSYRSRSTHVSIALAVVIDADTHTVAQRLNQLDSELADDNQPKRQVGEKIAVFIPKRNIETWIHYLRGQPVDETTAYPKLSRESECKPDVDKLVNEICRDEFPSDAPPSLHTACDELQRIL
jgi:hypothetical protein